VNDTVMTQQNYVVNEPVTTMATQMVDQGGFVDQYGVIPGTSGTQLRFIPRGTSYDYNTAMNYYHRGGFHRVPYQTPNQVTVNRVYVPNVVPVQVPQTHMAQRVVTQQVPVTVQRFVDEVVQEQVPVQVQRVKYEEEVRQVPVAVQRPQTETVAYRVPVQKVRYEEVEMVRQVPVTTQRIQYEEREEPVSVRVMKTITETRTERVPVTRLKQVPYTVMRYTPRTVMMTVPETSYTYAPSQNVIVGPVVERKVEAQKPTTANKKTEVKKEPTPETKQPKRLEPIPAEELEELDAPSLELKKPGNPENTAAEEGPTA
jgi:hypothetical protein